MTDNHILDLSELTKLLQHDDAQGAVQPTALPKEYIFDEVPVEKMFVDRYGRPHSPSRVRDLVENWNPLGVGTASLSYRAEIDRYAILDAQHRWLAAKIVGFPALPSKIYLDLTYEQESELYLYFANVKQQTATDKIRARLERRDPDAVAIKRAVEGQGLILILSAKGGKNNIRGVSAIAALEAVYGQYGVEMLQETLRLLEQGLGGHSLAYSAPFLRGMAAFLRRYPEMDDKRLTARLRRIGADELAQRAKMIQKAGISSSGAGGGPVGRALLGLYNSGLRTGLLPDWIERLPVELTPEQRSALSRQAAATVRANMGDEAYRQAMAARRRARSGGSPDA